MTVAYVVKPHGIKGEVLVQPTLPTARESFVIEPIFLRKGPHMIPTRIESFRPHGDRYLLRLQGINDRTEAERLRGYALEVAREDLPPLPEDTYYVEDMIGCRVIDEDGQQQGEVIDVMRTSGVDVLVVASPDGKWMLPAAKDYMGAIDLPGRVLRVSIPEGLRDLHVN